jgi:hypothetical protein
MVAGLWRRLFLVTVIQGDLRGRLRRPNGGEMGGKAVGFSWVVPGRLTDDAFISY